MYWYGPQAIAFESHLDFLHSSLGSVHRILTSCFHLNDCFFSSFCIFFLPSFLFLPYFLFHWREPVYSRLNFCRYRILFLLTVYKSATKIKDRDRINHKGLLSNRSKNSFHFLILLLLRFNHIVPNFDTQFIFSYIDVGHAQYDLWFTKNSCRALSAKTATSALQTPPAKRLTTSSHCSGHL